MKQHPLSTSLRSLAHATDSTRNGWTGEERRHHGARPALARRDAQRLVEQHGARGMEAGADQVMRSGRPVGDAEQRGVEHGRAR